MTSPRVVTEPAIDGWTVYSGPEWWEAHCDADPSLIVRHQNPARLVEACAAISQPPVHRLKSVQGPGGGFV